MRTEEEFQQQAEVKGITFWPIHECSICGYPCGYHFKDDSVYYDNGCNCTYGQNLNPRTWESVSRHYNMQTHPDAIKKYDDFWGFEGVKDN